MAYVIVTVGGTQVHRHTLAGPTTIGRAVESDLSIHDIALSRRHCLIEPDPDNPGSWLVTDLDSKNGTTLHGRRIHRATLRDGDLLHLAGRTTVQFRDGSAPETGEPLHATPHGSIGVGAAGVIAGVMADGARSPGADPVRPSDPWEALAATAINPAVTEAEPARPASHLPQPQPRPVDAASASDTVAGGGLIVDDPSSSLDAILDAEHEARDQARAMRARPLPRVGNEACRLEQATVDASISELPPPRVPRRRSSLGRLVSWLKGVFGR